MPPSDDSLAGQYADRTAVYETFGNHTLLELVRARLPQGGRVLDIGCASGGLLAALEDVAAFRAGIELSAPAAAAAARHADVVRVGDVTDPALDFEQADFDVVVMADVVEHTLDPERALRRAGAWARRDRESRILISIPNVGHWSARVSLARGRWEYADSGIFDRGHLRFYTTDSAVREVRQAGLRVIDVHHVVPALRNHVPAVQRAPRRIAPRVERSWQRLGRRLPGLMSFQIVVEASPR